MAKRCEYPKCVLHSNVTAVPNREGTKLFFLTCPGSLSLPCVIIRKTQTRNPGKSQDAGKKARGKNAGNEE